MPAKTPDALLIVAEESDKTMGDALSSSIPAPEKPYNPKVISSLTKALTALSKLMGEAVEFESYEGPQEQMPPDVARLLSMASEAAEDYGQPLPVALDSIRGDADLTAITAHIMALAEDRDFRDWLKEEPEEEEMVEEEVEEAPEQQEFDFMSRLKT